MISQSEAHAWRWIWEGRALRKVSWDPGEWCWPSVDLVVVKVAVEKKRAREAQGENGCGNKGSPLEARAYSRRWGR